MASACVQVDLGGFRKRCKAIEFHCFGSFCWRRRAGVRSLLWELLLAMQCRCMFITLGASAGDAGQLCFGGEVAGQGPLPCTEWPLMCTQGEDVTLLTAGRHHGVRWVAPSFGSSKSSATPPCHPFFPSISLHSQDKPLQVTPPPYSFFLPPRQASRSLKANPLTSISTGILGAMYSLTKSL